jgi:hypothetical protein
MSSSFLTTHFFTSAASSSVNCMVKIISRQSQTVRIELDRTKARRESGDACRDSVSAKPALGKDPARAGIIYGMKSQLCVSNNKA